MIPYVFVSSTVEDLHHLRDAIRDAIVELAYHPIMSEYGDIGYLPSTSVVESCALSVQECQLAVLIIGKRYGFLTDDGRSITHTEFHAARERRIPVICLVERDILTYKKVFDANRAEKPSVALPGMENADKTFGLIDEILRSPTNNAVLAFSTVAEARSLIKTQIAHLLGDLLRRGQDPIKEDVRQVLTELKTLRHEIAGGTESSPRFMRAARVLLDEEHEEFREILEALFETVDAAIPQLLDCELFAEVIKRATGKPLETLALHTWNQAEAYVLAHEPELDWWYIHGDRDHPDEPRAGLLVVTAKRDCVKLNERMLQQCQEWHREVRVAVYAA